MRKTFVIFTMLLAVISCGKKEGGVAMNKVISKDGTSIVFDRVGQGPAVILVDGAFCYRGFGPSEPLARLLKQNFTVYTYDRRGRGNSSDTPPYAVEREIEDIDALIKEAGGSAYVYGISSGAVLSIEAAAHLKGIKKLALYEPPFIIDNSHASLPDNYLQQLNEMLASDRRDDVVKLFLKSVGTPDIFISIMRLMPTWSKLRTVAHTYPYDITIVKDYQRGKPLTTQQWNSVKIPMIFLTGGKSPTWMQNSMSALTNAFPKAQHQTLKGQTHDVKPEVLTPILIEFFKN